MDRKKLSPKDFRNTASHEAYMHGGLTAFQQVVKKVRQSYDLPEFRAMLYFSLHHFGLNKADIAKKAGYSRPSLSQWMSGIHAPNINAFYDITQAIATALEDAS